MNWDESRPRLSTAKDIPLEKILQETMHDLYLIRMYQIEILQQTAQLSLDDAVFPGEYKWIAFRD